MAESTHQTHSPFLKNTPVGPVTGAILGLVLIIALSVYCYRHNIHRQPLSDSDTHDSSNCSGYNQESDGAYVYHELPAVPGPSGVAAGRIVKPLHTCIHTCRCLLHVIMFTRLDIVVYKTF